ncbi:hypothetical protein M8J77_007834 [Diaphorina citri]|nr:hypothetical protein M8J77_007834 [Diaphorina citri]
MVIPTEMIIFIESNNCKKCSFVHLSQFLNTSIISKRLGQCAVITDASTRFLQKILMVVGKSKSPDKV